MLSDVTANDALLAHPVIFIGTGRCGSTLLSEIVFRHPDFAFPSNYHHKYPDLKQINYIRKLFDNRFWTISGRKNQPEWGTNGLLNKMLFIPSEAWPMWQYIFKDAYDFSRKFLLNTSADEALALKVRNYFYQLVRLQGRKILGIKITGPSRIFFLKSIFPDARFVLVERDFFPTVQSFMRAPFWLSRGASSIWWQGAYSDAELTYLNSHRDDPLLLTGYQIHKVIQITRDEINQFAPDTISVSYESFMNNPYQTIESLFEKLKMKMDSSCNRAIEHAFQHENKGFNFYDFTEKEIELLNRIRHEVLL